MPSFFMDDEDSGGGQGLPPVSFAIAQESSESDFILTEDGEILLQEAAP